MLFAQGHAFQNNQEKDPEKQRKPTELENSKHSIKRHYLHNWAVSTKKQPQKIA